MKPESLRTLAAFSAILVVVGLMIMSPSAGLLLMILAALTAVAPAMFGSRAVRIAGLFLLIVSIAFAASFYPHFKSEQRRIIDRTKKAP